MQKQFLLACGGNISRKGGKELPKKKNMPHGFEEIRKTHVRAYLPWDNAQDEKLKELFVKGSPVPVLAKTFNRTRGAITSRLRKLGLTE